MSLSNNRPTKSFETVAESPDDIAFKKFSDSLIERFLIWNPSWAVTIGNSKFDGVLEVPTAKWLIERHDASTMMMRDLMRWDNKNLNALNRIDLKILRNQFEYSAWRQNDFKSYQWNPAEYNVGEGFDLVLNRQNKTLRQKLSSVRQRLANVSAYYNAAIKNIDRPTKQHLDLAILQNNGSLYIFETLIPDSVAKLNDPKFSDSIKVPLLTATQAIKRYVNYLQKYEQKPNAQFRDFRIGKETFARKFNFEIQSRYRAEEIYTRALKRKDELHNEMMTRTEKLWPKYFPNEQRPDGLVAVTMMINKLSEQHAHRDSFMHEIQKQLPELEAFVKEKNLVYIDPTKPLVVRKTPPYMEGSGAGASINDPGPFNPGGKTFYNVSLLTNYTPEQAESYLREYNDYILQILNIHEAIPGHYTQLVYSNQSPSMVKSVFGNGAMVEGWAVYTERMMLDAGYKATDEMWLMYYKWHLRSVMNTILDYSIHCLDMTEERAKDLMINEAFQQQAEADGKWKRATLSQVQLCSYFTGFTDIYDLREELKKKQGDKFNLKQFHEKFLSYGSAPVKYIRESML